MAGFPISYQTRIYAYDPFGYFLIDGKMRAEVGGPSKDFSRIVDFPDSSLAIDGIETDYGARIPLWMFGFLYYTQRH